MSLLTKVFTGTVLGAGAWAGWSYLRNLKTAGAELEVIPRASIHKLSWDGLTIRLDVLLKNPTKGSFSVKTPFVKLLYKETVVGSSAPVDKDIKIPAFGQVMVDGIMVQVPLTGVFSVAFSLVKALISGGSEVLTVRTLTTIDLGIIKLPYETKKDITIRK